MKKGKLRSFWWFILVLGVGMACQLTSPRPASWAGTPTAEARNTVIALTQAAIGGQTDYVFTPTVPTVAPAATETPIPAPTATNASEGPWLVYPAPGGEGLHAYDINTEVIIAISLPEPILTGDLVRGRSPDGRRLVIRAGSELNTDELALYRIDLPSFEVTQITPLLSIAVQRKIVNQDGTRAFDALAAVTRPDGLAWSPDGRFLAFTAALHNETSDLHVLDMLNSRINRLNGLFTQNASPLWAPGSNWLVSQELGKVLHTENWRSELVTVLRIPNYDSQNTIYFPPGTSQEEVFVGWLNAHNFISYSQTVEGPRNLRQVNVERLEDSLIHEGAFQQVAFDPLSTVLVFTLDYESAIPLGLSGGIYRLHPDSPIRHVQQVGNWDKLAWDRAGRFVAAGPQGVTLFTPEGDGFLLPDQGNARLSPNGNWLITWGDGINSTAGARLYQSASTSPLQTLIGGSVETLFWQPDSKAFFIQSEGTLYHFIFPNLFPNEIASGFPLDAALDMIWVE